MRQKVPNPNVNYLTSEEVQELQLDREYEERKQQGPDNAPRKEVPDGKRIP